MAMRKINTRLGNGSEHSEMIWYTFQRISKLK